MTATNTSMTFLMMGTGTDKLTYTKLIDIIDMPDLSAETPRIDVTTLSDTGHREINDIDAASKLAFKCLYTSTDYATMKALEGTTGHYAVWFGGTETAGVVTPTGSDGKFAFDAQLTVRKLAQAVGASKQMEIDFAQTGSMVFSAGA
ncbi:MAG: phage tail protein [Lachnospiraceae bacterium]|nr:phage tail protein [Lachnospiraceae bacterium]